MLAHLHEPIGRPTHGSKINFHPPAELLFAPVAQAAGAQHQSAHLPPLGAHRGAAARTGGHGLRVSVLGGVSRLRLSSQLRSLLNRVIHKLVAAFEGF